MIRLNIHIRERKKKFKKTKNSYFEEKKQEKRDKNIHLVKRSSYESSG